MPLRMRRRANSEGTVSRRRTASTMTVAKENATMKLMDEYL
jgi:hypothetical protein